VAASACRVLGPGACQATADLLAGRHAELVRQPLGPDPTGGILARSWSGRPSDVASPGGGVTGKASNAGAGPCGAGSAVWPRRGTGTTAVTGNDGTHHRPGGRVPSTSTNTAHLTGVNGTSPHGVRPSTEPLMPPLAARSIPRAGVLRDRSTKAAPVLGVSRVDCAPRCSPSSEAMNRTSASALAADSSRLRSRLSIVSASWS
jgi:hypothetical protein